MSIFKQGHWDAGAGLVGSDLTNISHFLRSQVFDSLASLARITEDSPGIDPPTNQVFAVGNSGAPQPSGVGLGITNVAGALFQKITAGVDGADARFAPYYVEADELAFTPNAADPTNPRLDLLAVKLDVVDSAPTARHFKDGTTGALTTENLIVTREARLQTSYVAGTPAATPTTPATPTGYVPWCRVYIPAAATILDPAHIHDNRVPIGLRCQELYPNDFQHGDSWVVSLASTQWGHLIGNDLVMSGAPLFIHPRGSDWGGRLMRADLFGAFTADASALKIEWVRMDMNYPAPGGTGCEVIQDITADLRGPLDATWNSTVTIPDAPLWLNGHRSGYGNRRVLNSDPFPRLGLRITPNAASDNMQCMITLARFYVAGE